MSETVTTEPTQDQTTTQVPETAPVADVRPPEAPKPAQQTPPRPRIPRPHCAC